MKILFIGKGIITQELYALLKPNLQYNLWIYRRNALNEVDNQITDNLSAALNGTSIIISCVPNDSASKSFWYNKDVKKFLVENHPICIEMSTLSYSFIIELYKYFEAIKCQFVEMPFTGSKAGAHSGHLSLFLHSNSIISTKIESFLDVISIRKYIFHAPGKPTLFKLFYNIWGLSYLYFLSEFGPILKTCFQNESDVIEILKNVGWMSGVCRDKLDNYINNDYSNTSFSLKHAIKDIDYALDILSKFNMPITKEIAKMYHLHVEKINENKDYSIISAIHERDKKDE